MCEEEDGKERAVSLHLFDRGSDDKFVRLASGHLQPNLHVLVDLSWFVCMRNWQRAKDVNENALIRGAASGAAIGLD
jgi:hypothetical protein